MADPRPLWEVMEESTGTVAEWGDMIRAVRDWMVPEELEPPAGEGEPWPQAYQQRSDAMWEQRQLLRALLTAEADRAERGETVDSSENA